MLVAVSKQVGTLVKLICHLADWKMFLVHDQKSYEAQQLYSLHSIVTSAGPLEAQETLQLTLC